MKVIDMLSSRENNFTLLRFFAALSVLYNHSYPLSLGVNGGEGPVSNFLIRFWGKGLGGISVDLFFVTSGFLVTASYVQRESLIAFIEARILRIYPGLIVALLFSTVFVGGVCTSESLENYFSSQITYSYIWKNMFLINATQYNLPSVFTDNPYPKSVNGSLWTLPIELRMYFWIAVLGSLSLLKDEKTFNAIFIILCLMYAQTSNNNFFIEGTPRNAQLALQFLLGAFFYINRSKIPLGFVGATSLCILVYFTTEYGISVFLKATCFAYLVLLLALHPKLRLPSIDRYGDISYGLYIYAFPVQQSIAHIIPQVKPLNMFMLSTVITVFLAILSWRLVEKPALKMKGKIRFGRHFDDIRTQ
jgi:peptidoglycan/LPS O-acetylase OafA/YrhL